MIKLTFTGDLMCNGDMLQRAQNGGSFDTLFADVKSVLGDTDYLIGNLETPVDATQKYTDEKYRFNTPETYLQALKKAGFDVLSLANNHCMDRGENGLINTVNACIKYGMVPIGTCGRDAFADLQGIRVGFLNYTYGTNVFHHHIFLGQESKSLVNLLQPEETLPGAMDLLKTNQEIEDDYYAMRKDRAINRILLPYRDKIWAHIAQAKSKCDYLIAVIHSGGQYNDQPDRFTIETNEMIKNAGADFIVGHHPHIIQRSIFKPDCKIAYCLGNFMFQPDDDDKKPVDPRYSAVLNLYLDKGKSGVVCKKIGFHICVLRFRDNGLPYVVDAFDAGQTERAKSLQFANRFAGENIFTSPMREYRISF